MGVDVARFGDDQSVIYVRQGFQTLDIFKFREIATSTLANIVIEKAKNVKNAEGEPAECDAIFVDGVGVGAGVVDLLRNLGHDVIEVNAGGGCPDSTCMNMRVYMWREMKEWLKHGSIPEDKELLADLIAPEYGYSMRDKMQLERKEDMKRRGLASPDVADALALTFAARVQKKDTMVRNNNVFAIENRKGNPWVFHTTGGGWGAV